LASDGKYYPPELAPAAASQPGGEGAEGEAASTGQAPTKKKLVKKKAAPKAAGSGDSGDSKPAAKKKVVKKKASSPRPRTLVNNASADLTDQRLGPMKFTAKAPASDQIAARRIQAKEQMVLLSGARQEAALRMLANLGVESEPVLVGAGTRSFDARAEHTAVAPVAPDPTPVVPDPRPEPIVTEPVARATPVLPAPPPVVPRAPAQAPPTSEPSSELRGEPDAPPDAETAVAEGTAPTETPPDELAPAEAPPEPVTPSEDTVAPADDTGAPSAATAEPAPPPAAPAPPPAAPAPPPATPPAIAAPVAHQPLSTPAPSAPMGTDVPFMEVRGSALGTDIDRIGEKILIFADRVEQRDRNNTVRQTIPYDELDHVDVQKKIMGPSLLITSTSGETMIAKALRPELATGARAMIEKHAARFQRGEGVAARSEAAEPAEPVATAIPASPAPPEPAAPEAAAPGATADETTPSRIAPAARTHKSVLVAMLDELHAAGILSADEVDAKRSLIELSDRA
jgi:hypothetical protein